MSFAARLAVNEGSHFAQEEKALVLKRLMALAEAGEFPLSVVQAFEAAALAPGSVNGIPTELRKRPAFENAFQHVHNKWKPVPKVDGAEKFKLGTPVSFGRARWSSDGASIFSVADGKELAQTPHRPPTPFERIRGERLARAQLASPVVQGYRLLPEFTPGRALLWGSIMAAWVTAASFITAKNSLGIQGAADAPDRLSQIISPYVSWCHDRLSPLREQYALPSSRGVEPPEIAQRLKGLFR